MTEVSVAIDVADDPERRDGEPRTIVFGIYGALAELGETDVGRDCGWSADWGACCGGGWPLCPGAGAGSCGAPVGALGCELETGGGDDEDDEDDAVISCDDVYTFSWSVRVESAEGSARACGETLDVGHGMPVAGEQQRRLGGVAGSGSPEARP